eukprot:GHVP01038987.1.p1 GENE.GHVP01038987.1~~GHVP01038987.1.p1  ORF type:complete len:919 (-),score=205.35 GHVP01038987.1:2500-4962(-)
MKVVQCCVQSGNNLVLEHDSAPTREDLNLGSGMIVTNVTTQYENSYSQIVRTLLMSPTKYEKEVYSLLYDLQALIIKSLKPGVNLDKVFTDAKMFVETKKPELIDFLLKDLGYKIGKEELREADGEIKQGNEKEIQANDIFSVSCGFSNVKEGERKPFSVWIADTIIVKADEENQVLTDAVNKKLDQISFEFNDEEEPDVEKKSAPAREPKSKEKKAPPVSNKGAGTEASGSGGVVIKDRLRSRGGTSTQQLEEAKQIITKQLELRKQKMAEITERFLGEKASNFKKKKQAAKSLTECKSYNDINELPKDIRPNRIHVDVSKESILLPIDGCHIPFHVSMIRNVVCQDDENKKGHSLRINFQVPGSSTLAKDENVLPEILHSNGIFLKELVFKTPDDRFPVIAKSIRDLRTRVRDREAAELQKKEESGLESLQLNRTSKRTLLRNLMLRHSAGSSRRITGALEAHVNGLRYTANRMETVDIIYSNIRLAIFQPSENDLQVVLHFHLKSPQLINKKRVIDIQFCTEIGPISDDLDQRRGRRSYDPDEVLEEQLEIEAKKKLNSEFKKFVEQVEDLSKVTFDIPFRKLGFYGVPKNSNVQLCPTARGLVQLLEWPVFVLLLEDVEVVSFERVMHGLRSLEIVFVFKDLHKLPVAVSGVPTTSLDNVKKWLNEMDMVWYENKKNMNWSLLMKTIREDVAAFAEQGAYSALLGDEELPEEGGEVEEGATEGAAAVPDQDSDEEDDEYNDEEESEESGSDASDSEQSDEESLADEDESSDGEKSLDSDEEEGMTWEELEQQAAKDDRKRGVEEEEEDRSKKRRKA